MFDQPSKTVKVEMKVGGSLNVQQTTTLRYRTLRVYDTAGGVTDGNQGNVRLRLLGAL
jgi:hypothetical protein